MCWLKQLDGISVGIFQLDLLSARTYFDFISKWRSAFLRFQLQRATAFQISHALNKNQNDHDTYP